MAIATLTTANGTQYTFDMWEGQVQASQPVVEFFNRIGQYGTGAQTVRYQGQSSRVVGNALFTSLSQAVNFQDGAVQLVGQRVRVSDWEGVFNVLVRGVTAVTKGGMFSAGAAKNYPLRVEVTLDLEAQ
jgi:hypothetical protein